MKIKVKWAVSCTSGTECFDLHDMNCKNVSEWDALSPCEKDRRIQEAIDNLPERTTLLVDSWGIS